MTKLKGGLLPVQNDTQYTYTNKKEYQTPKGKTSSLPLRYAGHTEMPKYQNINKPFLAT